MRVYEICYQLSIEFQKKRGITLQKLKTTPTPHSQCTGGAEINLYEANSPIDIASSNKQTT